MSRTRQRTPELAPLETELGGPRGLAAGTLDNSFVQSLLQSGRGGLGRAAGLAGGGALSAARATAKPDSLLGRFGDGKPTLKGGGIFGALKGGAQSAWKNADLYQQGDVNASQATANVLVDAGVGLGAGMAGAATGAAIGSIVPGAGTALGALIGFGAGSLASWATNKAAESSGLSDWAKQGLGGLLAPANEHLTGAWDGISAGQDWVSNKAGELWGGVKGGASALWDGAKRLGGGLLGGGGGAAGSNKADTPKSWP